MEPACWFTGLIFAPSSLASFDLLLLLALVSLLYVVFTLYPQHAQYPKHIHSSYIHERLYRSRGSLAIVHFSLAFLAVPPAVRCFVWKKGTGLYASTTYIWTRIAFYSQDTSRSRPLRQTTPSICSSSVRQSLTRARNCESRAVGTRCRFGRLQAAQRVVNSKFEFMQYCLILVATQYRKPRLSFSSTIRCRGDAMVW